MAEEFKPLSFLTRARGLAPQESEADDVQDVVAIAAGADSAGLTLTPKVLSPERRRASIEAFNAVLEARPVVEASGADAKAPAPNDRTTGVEVPELRQASPSSAVVAPERAECAPRHVPDALAARRIESLVEEGRGHAETARSPHTLRAYAAARRSFDEFRRHIGVIDDVAQITPEQIGLWITWIGRQEIRASTIRARLDGLLSLMRMNRTPIDRSHPAIRDVLAGLMRKRLQPAQGKAALRPEEVVAMADACDRGTKRGLRDRAILLFGFVSGLRRAEIVKLDCGRLPDSEGWIEIDPGGLVAHVRGKTGWREAVVSRGATGACPVKAIEDWMAFGRVGHGPLFRRIRSGDIVTADRLTDQSIYDLVREMTARIGLDRKMFGAHSLRAGYATFAGTSEAEVQEQLGHKTVAMTRRYRRKRDRFATDTSRAVGF